MKNKYKVFYLLFVIFACGAAPKYPRETKQFQKYITVNFPSMNLLQQQEFKAVLIPSLGCSSCLKKGWKHYDNDNFTNVVFITNDDKKISNKKEYLYIEESNSKVKMDDLFFMSIYPQVLSINVEGQITSIVELTPDGEAQFEKSLYPD